MTTQFSSRKSTSKILFYLILIGSMLLSPGINRVSTVSAQEAADSSLTYKSISEPSLAANDLSQRYIIFLNGIGTSASEESNVNLESEFGYIKKNDDHTGLEDIGLSPSHFVYFSYKAAHYQASGLYCLGWGLNGCSKTTLGDLSSLNLSPIYEVEHTQLPINQHAAALDWLIKQIIRREAELGGNAQIDLVGWSLGGLVSSYWASQFGEESINIDNKEHSIKEYIHSIVMIESPVGGLPLAEPFTKGCNLLDLVCKAWKGILDWLFGAQFLRDMQVELPGMDTIHESIVDKLYLAAKNFPDKVTSIESQNDYIVNGVPFPLCHIEIIDCSPTNADSATVGLGILNWRNIPLTQLKLTQRFGDLDGRLQDTPVSKLVASQTILGNHRAPLKNGQTAQWVSAAIQKTSIDTTPPTNTVDVALIIDSSSSMTENDPSNKRLLAARAYLTASLAGDHVGVVDFDDFARLASPLLRLPENKNALVNAIITIDSSGGTDIGVGVQAGCDALKNSTSGNSIKAAILLTDGQGSFSGQDSCFRDQGWAIYTFGFGSANDELLQQIASNTGGEFLRLPTSDFLCEFLRVRSKIAGIEPSPCSTSHIGPLETSTKIIQIPPGQKQVSFSTSWTGSDIEMTLISPSGRVIDRNTVAPDVIHDLGATFEVYTILNPEPGDWEVKLFGRDVQAGGEDVIFSFTNLPSTTSQPPTSTSVNPTNVDLGGTALVTVSLDNVPAEGYSSAEFSCTYDNRGVARSNILVGSLFGADPVMVVSPRPSVPEISSFIVAIAGSNGAKATTSGPVFTFGLTAEQTGMGPIRIDCQARASKGDGNVISLSSTGPATLTIGGQTIPPTASQTPTPSGSTTPIVTGTLTASPTALPPNTLNGQVLAGKKQVTIKLFDAANTLIASVSANPDGTFSITAPAGRYRVLATASGFLSAQGLFTIADENATTVQVIHLLAGDIDGNDIIDPLDALTIGMNYGAATPAAADLNDDGVINFLDIELLAANYRRPGPIIWQ